jgi:hypothetical protein
MSPIDEQAIQATEAHHFTQRCCNPRVERLIV